MADKHSISAELDQLVHKTKQVFQKLNLKRFSSSILLSTGVFLLLLLAVVLLEYVFYLPPMFKTVLWLFTIACSGLIGFLHYRRQSAYNFSDFYTDYANSSAQPGLRYAFDLKEHPRNSDLKFFTLALQKNLETVDAKTYSTKLKQYVHSRPDHKQFISFLALTGVLLITVLATAFLIQSSFSRALTFWQTYTPPNPYSFEIAPGNVTLEQGSELIPTIRFKGDSPEKLTLAIKTNVENTYRKRSPVDESDNQFQFSPLPISDDASYYFEMDGHRSPTFKATIQLRPRFEALTVQVHPPDYTKLDTTTYSYPFSQISAYPGSEITVKGRANKAVQSLLLIQKNAGDSLVMQSQDDRQFQQSWPYTRTDTLHFSMRDEAGLNNKNPFEFILSPIEDEHPFVRFISPVENIEEKNPSTLLLKYEAGDDFAISSVRLHYNLQTAFGDDTPDEESIRLESPGNNSSGQYAWEVQQLNLKPRDVLTFWVEVSDNDGFNGPKSSTTRKLTLSVPSITQYLDELDNKERDIDQTLDEVSESYQQMQEEYEQFKEQLKRNPEQNYEQKKKLEDVEDRQKAVEEKVDELNKKFEEMKAELKQDSVLSEETSRAYDELQKLIKEIDDPELQKALKELQESMGKLSPQQLQQAMENFEFNEQRYKERIKRTLELFKKLKLNSDLDKMATAFEELAKQEKALSEDESGSKKNQTEKQEAIKKDAQKMQQKLDSLSVNAPKKSTKQIEKLQKEATQELESVDKKLEKNLQEIKNKNSDSKNDSSIKQQQQEIQKQFQQLSGQMKSARQSMNQQQAQVNVQALQYILYSLLNLSENQEKLTRQTENLTRRSQSFVDKARQEQNIQQQFNSLSDSLFSVSSEIPQFSNAINQKKAVVQEQLATAVKQLAERNKSNSTFNQRQSLGGMNELASMIASLLRQIQNQKGGSGGGSMRMQQLMEQMQKMSGQQQKLNQQIQDYINDIQGDRLSNDQIERLNQMARQQNAIRKQLKELQQSGQLEDGDRVLSELERMAERMEETINDLRGGQTNDLLIERQQNILSRMLSAEKALQERDKEDKREGTTAEEPPRRIPPDVTLEELRQRIRNLLNDPEQTPYNEDYQKLIEQYFELLQELEKENEQPRGKPSGYQME